MFRNLRTSSTLVKNVVKTKILFRVNNCSSRRFLSSTHWETDRPAMVDRNLYILPNDTPVCMLECADAFKLLKPKEKRYAHHIAKASFDGGLTVFLQVSPESAAIFVVFYRLFKYEDLTKLKEKALSIGFTEDEWKSFVVYAAAVYSNGGNYKSFGDSKIIPGLPVEKITNLVKKSIAAAKVPQTVETWLAVEPIVASLKNDQLQLGFYGEGVTCYHGDNITKEDSALIDRYLKSKGLESWNTRLFKDHEKRNGKTVYRIKVASADKVSKNGLTEVEFEGCYIISEQGDYSPLLERCIQHLSSAAGVAHNQFAELMLQKYMDHFRKGSIKEHKDGSRYWIQDDGPPVESYIGFIENYRDPAGTRAEFEGFSSFVNKETSKKFQTLVAKAEKILPRLPWGKAYEKDKFLKPDFTALDVLAFSGSGIPAGINIPNYDEIRQNEGFKNVSLSNVISAQPKQKMNFLDTEDEDLMFKYHKDSFEVQVGLHELLGHGSGKLFQKDRDGAFNFDKNTKDLVSGQPVKSWYEPGETWSSKFGALSNAYEECRAEAVGYFLCCDADILEIFGYKGDVADKVKYVNWMSEIRAGLLALEFYNTEQKKWGQAHSYARYVLTKVCLEAGQGFVTIEEVAGTDGKPDLKFKLDKSKIDSVGKPAIGAFLAKLQNYKSTANFTEGKAMFEKYGEITSKELRWREICVARRKPRRMFVQYNSILKANGDVELIPYDNSSEGIVRSFVERYDEKIINDLESCWQHDKQYFPRVYSK